MIGIAIANSLGLNKISSGINPDAQAFITAAGITGATEVNAVNTLVNGLQTDGIWTKMKAIYPFVTDQRNLISYSEDFSNAAWIKSNGITITTNQTTAPDGSNTADKIVFGADVSSRVQQVNSNVSTSYVYSVYLKTNSGTTTLQIGNFDSLTTVTVTNAWQRFNVNVTTSNAVFTIRNNMAGNSADVFIWGAQFEMGNTLTTYQPQLGSAQSVIASQFKYNLKDPRDLDAAFRLVFNGGWTHSSTGATPNGTNGYADTFFNPNSSLSTSSAHFAKYNRTNDLTADKIDGSFTSVNTTFMQQNYSAGNAILGNVTSLITYTQSDSRGLFNSNRSATNVLKVFKNTSIVATNTTTITGMPTAKIYLGARNTDNSSASFYNTYQNAFTSIGDGLTDTGAANLYTRVQAFQTSLSRNI